MRDYAQLEQVGACTAIEVVKRIKGPSCRHGEETKQAMKSNIKARKGQKGRKSIESADATHKLVGWKWCHMATNLCWFMMGRLILMVPPKLILKKENVKVR